MRVIRLRIARNELQLPLRELKASFRELQLTA